MYMHVCMHVFMYVRIVSSCTRRVHSPVRMYAHSYTYSTFMCVCIYTYIFSCYYLWNGSRILSKADINSVCVYIYICIYIYIYQKVWSRHK